MPVNVKNTGFPKPGFQIAGKDTVFWVSPPPLSPLLGLLRT